jgi:hypothetical protein
LFAGIPEIRMVSPVKEGVAVLLNLNLEMVRLPGAFV